VAMLANASCFLRTHAIAVNAPFLSMDTFVPGLARAQSFGTLQVTDAKAPRQRHLAFRNGVTPSLEQPTNHHA